MAAPLADEGVVPTLGGPPAWQHRGTSSVPQARRHFHWDGRVSSRCEAAWSTSQLKALRAASHSPRPAMPSTCRCASWMWCSAKSTLPPAAARACRHSRSLVPGRRSRRAATASAWGSRTAGSSTGSRMSSSFSRHDQQGGTTAGLTRKGRTWGMGQAGLGATSHRKKGFPPLREGKEKSRGGSLLPPRLSAFKVGHAPKNIYSVFFAAEINDASPNAHSPLRC
ncbi:unnamed protein product [Ixodes pacificus]